MKKFDQRRDEGVTETGARVKVWTGLGTVMLASAALSLAPSMPRAGIPDQAAKPGPASSPSQLAQQGGERARVVKAVRGAKAVKGRGRRSRGCKPRRR